METKKEKRITYLGQVFESKGSTFLTIAVAAVFIYCLSLVLFADWSTYDDPFSAKGTAQIVGGMALVMLAFLFLVPTFNKTMVLLRRTQGKIPDTTGYYPNQPIYYQGPLSEGKKIQGVYIHEHESAGGLLVVSLDGVTWESARPDEVTPR